MIQSRQTCISFIYAAINLRKKTAKGNSGAPVVGIMDGKYELVGMVVGLYSSEKGPVNIGIALRITDIIEGLEKSLHENG